MASRWATQLQEKIDSHNAVVGIVGLGYVGLPLAELIIQKDFSVVGFERNEKRRKAIQNKHLSGLSVTMDSSQLAACDIIIICIQTPIHEDKTPNLDHLINASQQVAQYLRPGQLVTIESSINPGVTRDIVLPLLQKSGLSVGDEFFLAFSPERIDPGNTEFSLETIPKVVSGAEDNSRHLIKAFYEKIFTRVVPVSSLETAEMVKIFENTFRLINISLVNEMKAYTDKVGIDMWEVVKAASTKPFGFLPHFPGPGVGGHCIPVDPFYLYDDAKKRGIELGLIRKAGDINDREPLRVVKKTLRILQKQETARLDTPNMNDGILHHLRQVQLSSPAEAATDTSQFAGMKGGLQQVAAVSSDPSYKILLIGISYKPNIDDMRESPAIKIWELFEKLGHTVSFYDPYIPEARGVPSISLTEEMVEMHDIVVVVTNHANIDYPYLASFGKPIIDTRHVYVKKLPHIYYV